MRRDTPLGAGFSTIRCVGSALPSDVLTRVVGDQLPGISGSTYGQPINVTPREAANRAWAVLQPAWTAFRGATANLGPNDAAVGLTRDKWLGVLLRQLDFGRLRPTPAGGLPVADRSFAISHCHATLGLDVPMHLLGWGVDLDKRAPGVPGAAERAAHALLQEYLNRADSATWGLLSNGRTMRLLRDSSTLIGQSYVEFDLEAMFDGEVFSDFAAMYLLCHESRFGPAVEDAAPTDTWLERWRTEAVTTGTRALEALSPGVAKAIEALGTGYLRAPGNTLHMRLAPHGVPRPSGSDASNDVNHEVVRADDLHHALLRLVYRLLFLFVAEDRGLLLDPHAPIDAQIRYRQWFSTQRLRQQARRRHGTSHTDLHEGLRLVLRALSNPVGLPELALPGLGGLFTDGPVDRLLADQVLSNDALLQAVRHLTIVQPRGGGPKRVVDYRNLGAEELGSVYESLLELIPRPDSTNRTFRLESVAGNDRKTTGSYYTPTSLIDCLLDTALDPLLDAAERDSQPEAALLALTVCDPACGSGHFLVAAARRIAARVARVRASDGEPTPMQEQAAMHDVVERCIYGVDLNPMAAELAKVSLWLESMQAGRPLSFLSAHIKVGNSLLGTTPALLAGGIPNEAFTALEGDDKKFVSSLKKRNKAEREGANDLFSNAGVVVSNVNLGRQVAELEATPPRSLADVQLAESRLAQIQHDPVLVRARQTADLWCAAFVAPKRADAPEITHASLANPSATVQEAVADLAEQYRFFHWHLEFPQIFLVPEGAAAGSDTGWEGGFSCMVGNPPWERIKLQEQEFFAARDPEIAEAPNAAARKKLISALADNNPALLAAFKGAARKSEGESALMRLTGRYPLCGRGDINTYAVFAENFRTVAAPAGRVGIIVPTGIATDATTQHYFKALVTSRTLSSLYDFENSRPLFEGVHRSFKFCVLTLSGTNAPVDAADFAFFRQHPDDLLDADARFTLTPEEILLLNPNTGTCPVFRSRRDAEITLGIYRRVPILIKDGDPNGNPWGLSFSTMFHMSNDSHLFRTREQLETDGWVLEGNVFHRDSQKMLPLYEGKMIHHYDHRWATYENGDFRDVTLEEKSDPTFVSMPRYWVPEHEVHSRLAGKWDKPWLLGFRNVCRSTDERTMVSGIFPLSAVGNSMPIALTTGNPIPLAAAFQSFCFDYIVRQCAGGSNLNFFIVEQIPVPPPFDFHIGDRYPWIVERVQKLCNTALDLQVADVSTQTTFARDWSEMDRSGIRAELDAFFFHLYGLTRDEVEYVMDTFPIVKRSDESEFGSYRTKDLILAAFDTRPWEPSASTAERS